MVIFLGFSKSLGISGFIKISGLKFTLNPYLKIDCLLSRVIVLKCSNLSIYRYFAQN